MAFQPRKIKRKALPLKNFSPLFLFPYENRAEKVKKKLLLIGGWFFPLFFLFFVFLTLFLRGRQEKVSFFFSQLSPSFLYSLRVSLFSTLLSLFLGFWISILGFRLLRFLRFYLHIFFGLVLVLPPVIVGFTWAQILSDSSWGGRILLILFPNSFYSWKSTFGLGLSYVYFNLPLVILVFWNRLEQISQTNFQIGQQWGFQEWDCIRFLFWPNLKNTALHFGLLIFLFCFQDFNLGAFFAQRPQETVFSFAIYQSLMLDLDWNKTLFFSLFSLFPSTIYWVFLFFFLTKTPKPSPGKGTTQWLGTGKKGVLFFCYLGMAVACVFFALPIIHTLYHLHFISLKEQLFSSSFSNALAYSLALGFVSSFLALSLSLFYQWAGSSAPKSTSLVGRFFENANLATSLFLAFPGIVLAMAAFLFLQSFDFIRFPAVQFLTLAIVQSFSLISLYVFLFQEPFLWHKQRYFLLKTSLGLSFFEQFTLVDWPGLKKTCILAFSLCFILSLGDYSAITVLGQGQRTLSLLSKDLASHYLFDKALANNSLLFFLCFLIFTVSLLFTHPFSDAKSRY